MGTVNTKQATRRSVQYPDFEALLADLDRLEAADQAGTLVQHGNWTLGQNCHHIAFVVEQSLDGFQFSAPLPLRIIFRIMRPMILSKPFPPGIKLTGKSSILIPDADISSEQGLAELRKQLQRVQDGQRITIPSPIFGKLSHEQWIRLHCRHAELHLSFLDPNGGSN